MKKRICQMAALGSALLLAFSAPVQAASGNRKQFAEGYCNIYRDRNP